MILLVVTIQEHEPAYTKIIIEPEVDIPLRTLDTYDNRHLFQP
jgi:hypothetical protein